MSFDKPTRNALANMVSECRRLLTEDIRHQLQAIYGLQPDGTALPVSSLGNLDERVREVARELREWQEHLASTEAGAEADKKKAAFERVAHATAFTVLNRLAALRMCEERGHVIECVHRGMKSDGFVLYERFSGGALGARGETYRIFLERMFDELAVDLGALFDLRAPQSLVFPRERCLEDVLAELNKPDLAHLWKEDETIGWVYQYFNSKEERERMREESAAPRNSHELAVRNQFFTPRYVVEFLVDNTLGRIWYEMRKGETALSDLCRYLVCRPTEIFLKQGEQPPVPTQPQENLSQEELLKQPFCIPYRPKKDPRDLKVLDPACGSAHFLLYCFDLLEAIYEEAWADEQPVTSLATGKSLREEFPGLESLKRALPELILSYNLHGIDIDLRACQISALALWLRAQRTYQGLGLKGADRPKIIKSNIVCAEPMPGEKAFLEQFVAGLEPKVIGQVVQAVFEKMKLAGEAGSLLKIEDEIAGAVTKAKKQWLVVPKAEQGRLFTEDKRPEQKELGLDFSGITDEAFWEQAEDRIYDALQGYAEAAENGVGYQRRLFADDTARGFAFIDLCRKRYDMALMNPPFGSPVPNTIDLIEGQYPRCRNDVYGAFVERGSEVLSPSGLIGAITNRTGFFNSGYLRWRESVILGGNSSLTIFADLGSGVLDSALVETAAYCCRRDKSESAIVFSAIGAGDDKSEVLNRSIQEIRHGHWVQGATTIPLRNVGVLPNKPFAYWAPPRIIRLFEGAGTLEPSILEARAGLRTLDDFRFLRLWHEVPLCGDSHQQWIFHLKGGAFQRFARVPHLRCWWDKEGREIKALAEQRYGSVSRIIQAQEYYRRRGITYSRRTSSRFGARIAPADCNFSDKGPLVVHKEDSTDGLLFLLGFLNAPICEYLISLFLSAVEGAARSYEVGIIQRLPLIPFSTVTQETVAKSVRRIVTIIESVQRCDPTSVRFAPSMPPAPTIRESCERLADARQKSLQEIVQRCATIDRLLLSEAQVDDVDADLEPYRNFASQPEKGSETDEDEEGSHNGYFSIPHGSEFLMSHLEVVVGAAFCRWDVRLMAGDKLAPELPDPFASLPICPPGMLQNEQGVPITQGDVCRLQAAGLWNYPLHIPWDGILADDPGPQGTQPHCDDIVRRVQSVLTVIWKDRAEAIEEEVCEILGVKGLREYFRKPALFFADHLKRYSKSRRQAPIYWPLSTTSGSYTLWVYYHRLNDDLLHAALNKYVKPKIDEVEKQLRHFESELPKASGREASKLREAFEDTKTFLEELREFRDELQRVAGLPYKPNLNDGVLITASPLWKLFRLPKWRKALEECWKKLEAGGYDWAHLANSIWPDHVREVCKHDRSIAIAHGLEELCEVPAKPAKKKRSRKKQTEIEEPVLGDQE
jgi:hypothetical protein